MRLTLAVIALRLAVVSGALLVRLPGLAMPLLEWHGWRQTWTAYTALLFHEHGIDLLHPRLPIFGPPFEVPMELPLVQAVAALVMDAGVAPDMAMRLTHLGLFFLTAALLYGFLRRVAGEKVAIPAFVFFLFAPVNVLFSRASLVEFGATAGAIGFLWAGIAWRERPRWSTYLLALVAGTLGMLVKSTTPVFWALPLVLWCARGERAGWREWLRARLDPALIILCVTPVAAGFAWMAWADSIKSAQETTAFMTSTATRAFYYSSLSERLDPSIWRRIWEWVGLYVVGLGVLPLFALGLWTLRRSPRRAFWWGLLGATALPVAVFFGGYWRHDYYWVALTPATAAVVGLAVAWMFQQARSSRARTLLSVALGFAAVVTLGTSSDYWRLSFPPVADPVGVLPRARELAAESLPDDLVLILGRSYDPDLAYYARRQTLMLAKEIQTPHVMNTLADTAVRVVFSWDPAVDQISVVRSWAWTGVLSARTYVVGDKPTELRSAPLAASDDVTAFDAAARAGRALLHAPLRIPCDGASHAIPVGAAGTWLRLRPEAGAVLTPAVQLAPMPVRAVVFIDPTITTGSDAAPLSCTGSAEIVLESAVDAPLQRETARALRDR